MLVILQMWPKEKLVKRQNKLLVPISPYYYSPGFLLMYKAVLPYCSMRMLHVILFIASRFY